MKLDRPLRARLEKAGQGFLVDHLEQADEGVAARLLEQLETIDLDQVAALGAGRGLAGPMGTPIEPVGYVPFSERGRATAAAALGRHEFEAGRVAFALLAGGQASRLEWDGPKGAFPIGPATQRSLFRVLVEHLLRAGRDHGVLPPLAVTTSATTGAAIRTFFERHDCFGFDRDRLEFARQASLPSLDDSGRLMLAAPDRLSTSPDGHGGAALALETAGILGRWQSQGITTVCTFQVDNPLLQVADADFVGRLVESGDPIATKVVMKRRPEERLGVVVRAGGRPGILEYSEISDEMAAARTPDGQLEFGLGSIATHAFRLEFLRDALATPLPLHTARKQIPCLGEDGEPARRPGVKYERFIFDLFPRASNVLAVEVLREREFSPVKSLGGPDSPDTCRAALDAEYRRWYREAGKEPPDEPVLELSPLDALGPEDLA